MKKNLTFLTCTFLGTLGLFLNVDAATLAVGNDTTQAGANNRKVTLELKDDDLSNYNKVSFQLTISGSSYAELGGFSYTAIGSGLQFSQDGTTYTIAAPNNGTLTRTTLGNISYTTTKDLNGDFKIVPTNVKFFKTDGSEMHSGDSGIKIQEGTIKFERPKSTDATLTNLTVSQGTLNPEFNKETTEYTVQVKDTINTIRISATAAEGATTTGTGSKSLAMGENTYEIEVTAEDKTTKKTYTVKVIRGEVAEPSAYIKSLELNNIGIALSPEFDSKNNKYTVKIDDTITKIDFKYELMDPLAEVTIEGNEDFKYGENLVTIKVVSSDQETEETYEITVIKEEEESTAPIEEKKEEEEKKESKLWLIILIVIFALAILGGVIFLLFKKKNKNNKNNKDNDKPSLKSRLMEPEEDEEESSSPVELKSDEDEDYIPSHASNIETKYDTEEEGVTGILKRELYDDDKTQRFDSSILKEFEYKGDEDDIDKTKEFDFKNLE